MKRKLIVRIVVACMAYIVLFVLAATCGLIHPACYAYAGTLFPLFAAFIYLFVAANMRCFGAATVLNGSFLVLALIAGEGNPALIIGIVVITALAELIRKLCGYDTLKGVRLSFIPLAFSFYAYSAHWWTDTAGSLAAAVQEMPAGYADMMLPVIENIPVLIVMLVLVIPVAILGIWLAAKIMKGQAAKLD